MVSSFVVGFVTGSEITVREKKKESEKYLILYISWTASIQLASVMLNSGNASHMKVQERQVVLKMY